MWLIYALFAMLCASGATLVVKQLSNSNVDPLIISVGMMTLSLIFYAAHGLIMRVEFNVTWAMLPMFLLAAFCFYAGNLYGAKSIQIAPNPGYTIAILNLQVVLITVISVMLFGSKLTLSKGIGVLCMLIGGILLAL